MASTPESSPHSITDSTTFAEWPCVSVVISTYKRAHLLPRALDSVLVQTYPDFEVIVIHDGPFEDATPTILEDYIERFASRGVFCYLGTLAENSGYQCTPKNVGTHMARGDYIAYLDDDNEWTPDHLKVLVDAIEEGQVWPDFVYGRRRYVRDNEDIPEKFREGVNPLREWTEESVQRLLTNPLYNFIDTSDTLIAKGAMWRLHVATGHMWNENMRRFGDWELFARAGNYAGWRGRSIPQVVQIYHWTGENIQITRPIAETPTVLPHEEHARLRLHSNKS